MVDVEIQPIITACQTPTLNGGLAFQFHIADKIKCKVFFSSVEIHTFEATTVSLYVSFNPQLKVAAPVCFQAAWFDVGFVSLGSWNKQKQQAVSSI